MFDADEFLDKLRERMGKRVDALRMSFQRVRAGRAHPGMLESIRVLWHDTPTPLHHVCSVAVEDAQTLSLTIWDKQQVPAVEKAIAAADLGLNPVSAGSVVRVPLPALTEETRRQYVRQVRQLSEEARVAVRGQRRDATAALKAATREKALSEDEGHRLQERVQALTDKHIEDIDARLKAKEAALMEV